MIRNLSLLILLALALGCREESKTSFILREVPPETQVVNPISQPAPVEGIRTILTAAPPAPPPSWNWKLIQFNQVNTKVDMIFILDDSRSMAPHLRTVQENLSRFTQSLISSEEGGLIGLNLRVGFLSLNDPYRSTFRPAGQTTTAGELMPITSLQRTASNQQGNRGSVRFWIDSHRSENGQETPRSFQEFQTELRAAFNLYAVERKLLNNGPEFEDFMTPLAIFGQRARMEGSIESRFLREGAHLLIFFVTNGDSENGNHDPENVASPRVAHQHLVEALGGHSHRLHAMGAMMVRESSEDSKDPGMKIGSRGGHSGMPQCYLETRANSKPVRSLRPPGQRPPECDQPRGPVVLEEFINLANQNTLNRQSTFQRQAIVRLDGDREGFGRRFAAAARSLVEEISEVVIPLGDTHPSKDHQGRIQIVGRAFNLNSYYSRIGNLLNQTITPQIASGMTELGSGSNLSTEDRLRILGLFPQVDLTLRFQVVQTSKVIDLEMTGQEVARARSPSRRDEDQGHSNPSRASSLARYNPTDNTLRLTLNSQLRNLSFRTPIGVWIAWERATTSSPQK